jgi:hypothetical protein
MIAPAIGGYDEAMDKRLDYDPPEPGRCWRRPVIRPASADHALQQRPLRQRRRGLRRRGRHAGASRDQGEPDRPEQDRFAPLVDQNKTFFSIQGYSPSTLDALNTLTRLFATVDRRRATAP